MIKPYLTDLINNNKPLEELNDEEDNNDTERGEWKVQPVMQINCISTKDFEDTRTIYSASKPVEVFMGSDTNNVIDRLFNTTLQRFQEAIKTSNDGRSEFTHESVVWLQYYFQKIDIRGTESYINSRELLVRKEAVINPKNQKYNKCFQYAITVALNYNKIKKKYLKKNRGN